jgi:hypothetical protein
VKSNKPVRPLNVASELTAMCCAIADVVETLLAGFGEGNGEAVNGGRTYSSFIAPPNANVSPFPAGREPVYDGLGDAAGRVPPPPPQPENATLKATSANEAKRARVFTRSALTL